MKKLFTILITFSLSAFIFQLSFAQWEFNNPLPQGNTLRDIHFFNPTDGLAVGDGGTIMKTDDGGLSWELDPAPTKSDLYAVSFMSNNIGLICGSGGTILRTPDGGDTWEEVISGTTITLRDIHFPGAPRGLVVGDYGTMLISYNSGLSWNALNSNLLLTLHSVYCIDPLEAIAVGDSGTIVYTSNGGALWEPQQSGTTQSLKDIQFIGDQTGWICGDSGTVLSTFNAGNKWKPKETGTEDCLNDVCFLDENMGWVVGQNGAILFTENGGTTWTQQPSTSDRSLNAFCSSNGQNCYAVGDNGAQMMTTDGGTLWTSGSGGFYEPEYLRFAGFTDDLHGWACNKTSEIVHTSDGGNSWTVSGSNPGNDIIFTDPQQGWCIFGPMILHTEDGGITWDTSYYNDDTYETFRSIYFINPDKGWVGGIAEVQGSMNATNLAYIILRTTNGGDTWSRKIISRPLLYYESEFLDLYFESETRGWAIGITFGWDQNFELYFYVEILKTLNGGISWAVIKSDLNPFSFYNSYKIFFTDYTGYVINHNGSIYKTINSGSSWELLELGYEVSARDIFFSYAEIGWAVGNNGAILHTTDGGISWTLEESHTGYDLNRILFTENGDGWIFGENSTILHFADTTTVAVKEPAYPRSFAASAYPNPFSGTTSIYYNLDDESFVSIKIFNYSGQLVTELSGEKQSRGDHQVNWKAETLPSGIYFYRLSAGEEVFTGKMVLVR